MAKPGKYDAIVKTLKHADSADPPYQERVNVIKEELKDLSTTNLAAAYIELRKGNGVPLGDLMKDLVGSLGRWPTQQEMQTVVIDCYGKEGIEALLAACNLHIEAATQLLVASQDRGDEEWGKYGVKPNALRLENGDTIRVHSEPYGQVKDKEAFRLWCIAPADVCRTCNEREGFVMHDTNLLDKDPAAHVFNPGGGMERQLQLWPATMNAIAKERAVNGDPYPDGVEVFRKEQVKFIAAGGKDE